MVAWRDHSGRRPSDSTRIGRDTHANRGDPGGTLLFGGMLFAAGVVSLITSIFDWRVIGFLWRLMWGAIATLAGLCILFHFWLGALSLTLLLGASLMLQGAITVGHAVAHRHQPGCPWG